MTSFYLLAVIRVNLLQLLYSIYLNVLVCIHVCLSYKFLTFTFQIGDLADCLRDSCENATILAFLKMATIGLHAANIQISNSKILATFQCSTILSKSNLLALTVS